MKEKQYGNSKLRNYTFNLYLGYWVDNTHSSVAILIKYSLSILKSLHPSSDDRSEAPRLL